MNLSRRDITIIAATLAAGAVVLVIVLLASSGGAPSTPSTSSPTRPSATSTQTKDPTAAARASIQRNATRYQHALNPTSHDNPCRYMTDEAQGDLMLHADPAVRARGCKTVVRKAEAQQARPLDELLDDGVTDIQFSPRVTVAGLAGTAAGAQAVWRGDRSRTITLVERDGQWLIAK